MNSEGEELQLLPPTLIARSEMAYGVCTSLLWFLLPWFRSWVYISKSSHQKET